LARPLARYPYPPLFRSPAQWRVLRAAVSPGPDDLFITGDPHQRIYDSRVSLGSLGIATAGRSFRLRVNYRSTEEILAWSARLLRSEEHTSELQSRENHV